MKKCFKYRSFDSALKCLQDGTLYFSHPSKLNDILETKYQNASFQSFISVMEQTLNQIARQRGESKFNFDHSNKDQVEKFYAAENKRLENFLRDEEAGIGIFSAATRVNDQAMWAYYAQTTGVCFELEWSSDFLQENKIIFRDVDYKKTTRIHNRAEDWKRVFLELARNNPIASVEDLQELSMSEENLSYWGRLTVSRAASVKHTDWKHEKEIRFLKHKHGALHGLSSVLKKVHFVHPMCDNINQIDRILKDKYPLVELVRWEFIDGNLKQVPMVKNC